MAAGPRRNDTIISAFPSIVSTTNGVAGTDLEHDVHALITDEVDGAFRDAVCTLVENPATRETLRSNLRTITAEYSWDRSVDRLADFYTHRLGQTSHHHDA